MNWNVVALLVTIGLAQAGLVVALVDRLVKAEIRLLTAAIEALRDQLGELKQSGGASSARLVALEIKVNGIETRLYRCLRDDGPGPCQR